MKPDTSFVLKSGHFYLLTTLMYRRLFDRNLADECFQNSIRA
jgi:hypothetical protein